MRKKLECQAITLLLWVMALISLVAGGILLAKGGVWTIPIARFSLFEMPLDLAFRLDPLSSIIACMVLGIAAVVAQYSLRYLDGEPRQFYFYKYLFNLILAVLCMILSNNLLMLFLAWTVSSFCLHKLLLFYSNHPEALYAARKKWIVSRIGDGGLLTGIVLIYLGAGSFEFLEIFALVKAQPSEANQFYFSIAALFLVIGAMAKSAQFPFHFWLPESINVPTPISAIMHAGIINGGGYLLLRLSPLMEYAGFANHLLVLVGALTACYGALVMMTCNDIKRKLAFSTISQMGMMIFAIGLGAYVVALFHIIAHSIYKSYAFLSTGNIVKESWLKKEKLHIFTPLQRVCILLGIVTLAIYGAKYQYGHHLSYFTYGSILLLGLIQNFPRQLIFKGGILFYLKALVVLSSAAMVLILTEVQLSSIMKSELAASHRVQQGITEAPWIAFSALGIFLLGFWVFYEIMATKTERSKTLYVRFWNDFYFNDWSTVLLEKIWPVQITVQPGGKHVAKTQSP